MLARRFPLRLKIAAFASGLLAVAVTALGLFTVVLPWRQKLAAQEHSARSLIKTLGPQIVRFTSSGVHWNSDQVQRLVANSHAAAGGGLDVVYALLFDEKGRLNLADSSANPQMLHRVSPQLSALYLIDRDSVLQTLAKGQVSGQINPVKVKLASPDKRLDVGNLIVGISTASIDAEARTSLLRGLAVLLATVALGFAGAVWMGGHIVRPLEALQRAMDHLGQGDFEQQLREPAQQQDEIGDLARSFNAMAIGLGERERLKGTLGRYVSGDVAERILSEQDDLSLRGELRAVTVLFLDVRGFTAVSESLPPAETLALLNEYFDRIVACVTARGGSVNKFIGDAAMCLWGAPRPATSPERDAVLCALEIQQAVAELSQARLAKGLKSVALGIGINAGEAVAGNLGAAQRLEYTVIGDAVNLAQRLESQARPGEVLVSQDVFGKVSDLVEATQREDVKLKGRTKPVALWAVTGLRSGAKTEAA